MGFRGANSFVGFATSVIACGCEAGIESHLNTNETPDGRPVNFNFNFLNVRKDLAKQILNRAGQCVMTSPTSALFSGNFSEKKNKSWKVIKVFW